METYSDWRILCVNDCVDLLERIAFYVEWVLPGLSTGRALDGRAALEELRRARYTLVWTDIGLPAMDGRELIRAIRGGETEASPFSTSRSVPIIVCTGYSVAQVPSVPEADALLRAPCDPGELVEWIVRLHGHQRADR